jgi:predicted ATPase
VIKRFYIHNFRCLENFEIPVAGQSSALLIGKNGSGKTTVGKALEVLQQIARGVNRIGALVQPKDLGRGRHDVRMRFELEAELKGEVYLYKIAFELPKGFRELRVAEEALSVSGDPVFTREEAQVVLPAGIQGNQARFRLDWHLAALPVVQERTEDDPFAVFKRWLSRMIILRPIPSMISGESNEETLTPDESGADFGAWFSGLIAHSPSVYGKIDSYLRQVLPDLKDIKNPAIGKDARSLEVQFSTGLGSMTLPFSDLSDGEKCFMICAMVLAANKAYGPLTCFWDEPDNYLALSEVGHFILALRKTFQSGGQFIATSHNPEAIRTFSHENTHVLYRANHLEPTQIRTVSDLNLRGDLVAALVRGDLEP